MRLLCTYAWIPAVAAIAATAATAVCAGEPTHRFGIGNVWGTEMYEPAADGTRERDSAMDPQVVVLPSRPEPLLQHRPAPDTSPADPLFVTEALHPSGRSVVFGVADVGDADIVILDHGLNQGFRIGMVCHISRGDQTIGEILLVEVRNDRAAGLITRLQTSFSIQSGDIARIQTLQL